MKFLHLELLFHNIDCMLNHHLREVVPIPDPVNSDFVIT